VPHILWKPSVDFIKSTNMTAFTRWLTARTGTDMPNYDSLHQWSIDHLEDFWESFVEFTDIKLSQDPTQVLDTHKMPGARWFSGMQLNFAENIFARNFKGAAILFCVENDAFRSEISFEELKKSVARCARGLKKAGIRKGDTVAGYIANVPEAIITCLACASIGAVWTSASPDFGLNALCDRFQQVKPKLIFASSHYQYSGKIFKTDNVVKQLKEKIPSIQTIVSIPYPIGKANLPGDKSWQEFLEAEDEPQLEFTQLPFDHPLYILFSSGTTGVPKCIVHGAGGSLLQHRKELQLHTNLTSTDSLLFFTTCGWMMWNWQLSALSLGTKICLYDGNPGYSDLTSIWRYINEQKITHFGTSGRFIESCMKSQPKIEQRELGELSELSTILYTGSPLSKKGFRWIYETVKKDVHLAGISGGTDIVSCFILGNPNLPVRAGEIQCRGLGVDVAALNEHGEPVFGEPGELVCRQPMPSMPIYFLNDPDGVKYKSAYFDAYPGLWRHGDFVEFTQNGGVIVCGRSDATLNPGGVRIGSAEIYSALDHFSEISGSVVVTWTPPGELDEVIVLFVVPQVGNILHDELEKRIRQIIREKQSPRHVPKYIFQISGVPVTRSGKTVELSVKAVLAGKVVKNRNALANPEILEEIEKIRETLSGFYSAR